MESTLTSPGPAALLFALILSRSISMNVQLVCSTPPSVRTVIITFTHFGAQDARFVAALETCPSWSALDKAIVGRAHIAQLVCVVD